MTTTLIPVKSSAVKAYGYDAAARILTIETPAGKRYRYGGVPPDRVEAFASSESIGRAWGSLIRGQFGLVQEDKAVQS